MFMQLLNVYLTISPQKFRTLINAFVSKLLWYRFSTRRVDKLVCTSIQMNIIYVSNYKPLLRFEVSTSVCRKRKGMESQASKKNKSELICACYLSHIQAARIQTSPHSHSLFRAFAARMQDKSSDYNVFLLTHWIAHEERFYSYAVSTQNTLYKISNWSLFKLIISDNAQIILK